MDTYEAIRVLNDLARAIETRREANRLPGISCHEVRFFYRDQELNGSNENAVLRDAIKAEIRISWDELRERALKRLDDSVAQLAARASAVVEEITSPPSQPDPAGSSEGER